MHVGRVLARDLRVLEQLGSTPDGPLYRGRYPNGAEVSLVVLRPEAAGGASFRRDLFARATQIQHPNIAAVYDVGGMDDGTAYVVLEQVVGEPLADAMAAGRAFALTEAIDLALQAAGGVQAAYRAGFVHGNLSPWTILVTPAAHERPQIKVVGFAPGPALVPGGAQPPLGEVATQHASPERLVGHAPDEQSEVFSLGAVLHHLLTGVPPDRGHVGRSVPRVVRRVLDTALAPDPASRFQSIAEFDEALRGLDWVAASRKGLSLRRPHWIGAIGASLALIVGGVWLLPGLKGRATGEERSPPVAPAPSLIPGPGVARQVIPGAPNRPADPTRSGVEATASESRRDTRTQSAAGALPEADADSSSVTGTGATGPTLTERFTRMERAVQQIVRKLSAGLPLATRSSGEGAVTLLLGDSTARASTARVKASPLRPRQSTSSQAPAATAPPESSQREDSSAPPEALGYVGNPVTAVVPVSPPEGTVANPRPRAELERHEGLRQSIGDVVRMGIAEDVAEIRRGSLLVSLAPSAMDVSSLMYNLQRLYLAYSAATGYQEDVVLVLRRGRELYGRFTRDGLTRVPSD
ncbi:MAG: protein kinase [Gemmatimonadales bacterium]|nr:protein kinase [Gemmatimonadales bacterium]